MSETSETRRTLGRLLPQASYAPELSDAELAILAALSDEQKLAVAHGVRIACQVATADCESARSPDPAETAADPRRRHRESGAPQNGEESRGVSGARAHRPEYPALAYRLWCRLHQVSVLKSDLDRVRAARRIDLLRGLGWEEQP